MVTAPKFKIPVMKGENNQYLPAKPKKIGPLAHNNLKNIDIEEKLILMIIVRIICNSKSQKKCIQNNDV